MINIKSYIYNFFKDKVTMATGTSSPTPSEDNRQNNRDDSMYSALDKIMGNTVQTYDDFLNSFTFLKKGINMIHVCVNFLNWLEGF